jgi:membrane protease YdiL (CAAX protease family)
MLATFSLAFFLALPFFDLWLFKRHLNAPQQRNHKLAYYAQLLSELWIPTIVLFVLVGTNTIQLADIGLGQPELEAEIVPAWVSIGLVLLAVIFIVYSLIDLYRLKYDARYQAAVKSKLQSVKMPEYMSLLMPSSSREKVWYGLVAISAGITEEILYRGFLTYVLVTSIPAMDIWLSIVVAAFLFGLGHLYQGLSGMLRTFVLGLILSLIYLATGTLLLSIIIHMLIDLAGTLLETAESAELHLTEASAPN